MSARFVNDRKAPRQPTSAVASADQAVPGTGPRLRAAENELERLKDKLRQMEMNTGCIHSPQPTRLRAAESGIETLKSSLGHMEMNTGTARGPNPDIQKNSGPKPGIKKKRIPVSKSDSKEVEDSESGSGEMEVDLWEEARAAEARARAAEARAKAAAEAWRKATETMADYYGKSDEQAEADERADDLARDVANEAVAWAREARAEVAEARAEAAEARAAEERAAAAGVDMNVYACHQQTFFAQTARENWIGKQNVQNYSLRLSMPPFNAAPPGVQLNGHVYVIPVYGIRISKAIMDSFTLVGIPALAQELGVSLPRYGLSEFIQGKMHKVRRLISEARLRDDCQSGVNLVATSRLERFVEAFVVLRDDEIDGPDAWHDWVCSYTADDWMEKQEFSHLLSNFGFSTETATEIQSTEIDDEWDDGSLHKITLEQYSLRWLSKAFAGYNALGCLTDIANLLFAMKGPPPATKPTEDEVVAGLEEVVGKLRANDLTDIWIPTHMIHDAETDDMLAWLLLTHVHRLKDASSSPQATILAPMLPDVHCI